MCLRTLRPCFPALVLLVSCFSLPASAVQPFADKLQHFEDLSNATIQEQTPFTEIGKTLATAFASLSDGPPAPSLLKNLPAKDLLRLFQAARVTAFYSGEPAYARNMLAILGELESRRLATPDNIRHVYANLIYARMMPEAATFRFRHPSTKLEALPSISQAPGLDENIPSKWIISSDANTMERRPVNLHKGAQVVAISSPYCHFSQDAARDLDNSEDITSRWEGHIRWLSPQDSNFSLAEFQAWNREHPKAKMSIAYRRAAWRDIDAWATPIFYFFKDGVLQAKVTGWPEEGNKAALRDALALIGL